jgi:hypothetical protein
VEPGQAGPSGAGRQLAHVAPEGRGPGPTGEDLFPEVGAVTIGRWPVEGVGG